MRSMCAAACAAAFAALLSAAPGCGGAPPGARPGAVARSPTAAAPPAWVPPLTPEQRALLTPPDEPIQLPAARVFPDLSRFGYAGDHRMEEPQEALRFTKMVLSVLRDSPRFYVLGEAAPNLANPVAQYGPAPEAEPDAWSTVRRDPDGVGQLERAPIGEATRAALLRAEALRRARDLDGARAAFEHAAADSPAHPAIRLGLAQTLAARGDIEAAEQAFRRVLDTDPTLASAHTGLAELGERRGDLAAARHHVAEALAYHPVSPSALAVARRLSPVDAGVGRVAPFAIFLDVDATGAVHAAAAVSGPAQVYAGCRAILRYEPEVRAKIFEQPVGTPYYLSVVEELVCHEAAIGAYIIERAEAAGELDPTSPHEDAPEAAPDPSLEALSRLAVEEGLSGYVMFEILGRHRPERARGAPPELHKATVRYIERYVLDQGRADAPGQIYTVLR